MSTHDSSSDLHVWSDPELEARIIAHVLGESSDYESAQLQEILAENVDAQAFHDRIAGVDTTLREKENESEWRLSDERRGKVLDIIGEPDISEKKPAHRKSAMSPAWRAGLGLAACFAVVAIPIGAFSTMGVVDREQGYAMLAEDAPDISAKQVELDELKDQMASAKDNLKAAEADLHRVAESTGTPIGLGAFGGQSNVARGGLDRDFAAEMTRRSAMTADADDMLAQGRDAYANGRFDEASRSYRAALATLPESPTTEARRSEYQAHLADAEVMRSRNRAKKGDLAGAKALVDEVLAEDPDNKLAPQERAYLDDPIQTNQAITRANSANVDDVRRALYTAQGHYDLGDFDAAEAEYHKALRKDKYNTAARRGLEQVTRAKSDYYRSAYDESRSELLSQVDAGWELEVPGGIEVERETQYAGREFQPPEEPQAEPGFAGAGGFPVTPATPAPSVVAEESDRPSRKKELEVPRKPSSASQPKSRVITANIAGEIGVPDADEIIEDPVDEFGEGFDFGDSRSSEESRGRRKAELTDVKLREALQGNIEELGLNFVPTQLGIEADGVVVGQPASVEVADIVIREPLLVLPEGRLVEEGYGFLIDPSQILPPDETLTSDEPTSTFSLHVSDVSFRLAHAALTGNGELDPTRIRPEEFYNAFDYSDPAPDSAQPVACAIEACAHPTLQGRDLVRIGITTAAAGRATGKPLNVTICLDTSGSMQREDRLVAVRHALGQMANLLGEGDTVSIVGFSRDPRLLVDRAKGSEALAAVTRALATPSEGGTNLEEALDLAREQAQKQFDENSINRIIFLTDGGANLGNADGTELAKRVVSMRQRGIAFDACGVGVAGLNDTLLEELARDGDGRYFALNGNEGEGQSFAKQLAGAFRPAAENVKVQVIWNPDAVESYALNGFAEHRLEKEDFRNDSVDAAELAAEEAANALYTVNLQPDATGDLGTVYVRFRDAATGQMVERNWAIRRRSQSPAFDEATPSMQLAGLALATAQACQGRDVDWERLMPLIGEVKATYVENPKVVQLEEMIRALQRRP